MSSRLHLSYIVRVTIQFYTNACVYRNGNGRPMCVGMVVQDKRVQASDKTGMDRTMAVSNCQEYWRIPADATYVQGKFNKLAYKGVKSC